MNVWDSPLWYNLAVIFLVLVGVTGVPMATWAVVTRPAWWELRDTIYWDLCCIGLLCAWLAFNYLIDLNLIGMAISFFVCSWLCFLAKEHFNQ
jgi:hypothetical protein